MTGLITDPTMTQGLDAQGKSVYVGDPSLNPQFSYPKTQAPTTPTVPSQTPKPQTAFSSDQGAQQAHDNTQALQTLRSNGLTVGQDGLARYSDMSFAAAPSDAIQTENGSWQSGGVQYAIGPSTVMDPELKSMFDQINTMKTQFDSTSRAQIDNITSQFNTLIKQQQDINKRGEASVDQSLLMGGSSRYAQVSSAGQSTAMMSYGLSQIADLNQKEQSAITSAQAAQDSGDMKLMDSQLSLAQQARKDKQTAAQALSDSLTKQNDALKASQKQAAKDASIQSLLSQGIVDTSSILSSLRAAGDTTTSAKDIADTLANLSPDAKEITNVMGEASKFGAPKDVLALIGKSKNLTEAYQAAGKYLQDPTSNAAMYNSYVQRATAKGQTPISAEDFLAKQKYNEAYSTKAAQNAADAAFSNSDKGQQKLEQEYRGVLVKEISNRSGGLGLQDQKVNQAIHLKALIDSFKDKNGNYNIPTAQYKELTMGLATLLSPAGQTSDADRREIMSKTAAGDFKGALQYVTGEPQNGNTQAIIKNLIDSIDRQGKVSEDLRDQSVQFLHGLAPTDLSSDRIAALEKNTLASYRNPPVNKGDQIIKDEEDSKQKVVSYGKSHPEQQGQMSSDVKTLEQTLGRKATNAEFLQAFPEYSQ